MKIKCYLTPFPNNKCNGAIAEIDRGYLLLLNTGCCDIQRRKAFGHEMAHIVLDHMNQLDRPIMDCEREANDRAWEFYRQYRDEYNALVNGAESFEI